MTQPLGSGEPTQPEASGELISTGTETVARFAKRHGVTAQTVRNWIKKGIIPAIDPDASRLAVDSAKADAALALHRRGNQHGGSRRNAGRPKKESGTNADTKDGERQRRDAGRPRGGSDATQTAIGDSPIETIGEIRTRAEAGELPDHPVRVVELLNLAPHEVEAVVLMADAVGLTQQKLDWLRSIADIRKRQRENDEAEGRLVDAEKARAAFAAANGLIRSAIESLPRRVAKTVATIAWPTGEAIDEVCDLIRATGADGGDGGDRDTVAAVRRILARPDDLHDAIAVAIGEETNRIRKQISNVDLAG